MRRRHYTVVLLDEVEKAHPDVFNILLQIFDDGRISDSKGRVVNCKNALFIMTSNLGSDLLLNRIESGAEEVSKEEILAIVDPVVKGHFRPEFLNRLDEILPFLPLREEAMEKIVKLELLRLQKRMENRHILLSWSLEAVACLAREGYDPLYGARPLKRLIQSKVVNMLSVALLDGSIRSESLVKLVLKGEELTLELEEKQVV